MKEEYLLVDGYNIIFAWEELKELAAVNIDAARLSLQDILANYQGYKKNHVVIVYDGYKVKGNLGTQTTCGNLEIIFTKEAETADSYIEKMSNQLSKEYYVTVATSDFLEQMITMGHGSRRLSATEFKKEIEAVNRLIREQHLEKPVQDRNYLFQHASKEVAQMLEKIRLNEK
ncbi:MAG: NYN domain-containing protein [Candidatus Ruminococcus intestinipullorum]|nr:NYN domain-containing protein [Candidatus Ruminococcus intestinipullorum]